MDGRLEEGVVVGDRVQTPEVNVSLNSLHFECCSASVGILTDAGRCRAGWLQQRPPAGAAASRQPVAPLTRRSNRQGHAAAQLDFVGWGK